MDGRFGYVKLGLGVADKCLSIG